MQASSPKNPLPILLASLIAKRSALLLQKLALYQPNCDSHSERTAIRHYDYDCEGIFMLAGFFKKKQQSILVKTFNLIKTGPVVTTRRLPTSERKPFNGTTRRTNLNSTFTASEVSPIKRAELYTIRSNKNDENAPQLQSAIKEGSKKLHDLLSRVKAVNISNACETDRLRTDHGPNRENATYYLGNSNSRYISNLGNLSCRNDEGGYYNGSQRQSRRHFILEKFRRIQSDLSELQEEGVGSMREEIDFLRQRLTTRAIRRSAKA